MRRTEYLSEFTHDIRFAVRQLLRNPGFTTVAVVTLALGIGATAAIFSAVHAVVLRPIPVPHPERIIAVYEELRGNRSNVSAGNFVDGVQPVSAFSHVTAIQYSSFNLADEEDAERVIGARTTAGKLPALTLLRCLRDGAQSRPSVHHERGSPGTGAGRRPQSPVVDETLRR